MSPARRRLPPVVIIAAIGLAAALPTRAAEAPPGRFVKESRALMGTRFQIAAWAERPSQERAVAAAFARIEALDRLWSPWHEGSDLARINAHAGGPAVTVDAATIRLLERSLALCRASARGFDPTFFALKPLYDFRQQPFVPPSGAALAERLPLVDCRQVQLDPTARTVRLARRGMALHLGGNAKGTSLDAAAAVLRAAGIARFVVDGGGDIVAAGHGPQGPWRVGIQHPRAAHGELIGVVRVADGGAVATSGDYERFAIVDGRRYHHIVDPRTGLPAAGCMSATVFVPAGPHAGERADGLATALCVLGPEAGFELLAATPGAAAGMVTPDGAVHRSAGFVWEIAAP